MSRDRAVSSDAVSSGHRATSITVDPAGSTGTTAPTVGTQAIFGPDDRVPVDETTTYPASATVLLTFPGGRCTGFMISERTVATAGHCVHTGGSNGQWRTNIVAYPGHNGTTAPFGGCMATRLFAPQGWTGSVYAPGGGDPAYDYGAVQLNCAIGNRTGWYGLGYPAGQVTGSCTTTHGYPVDRPGQWASTAVVRAEDANFIYVQNDFTTGQDGSPVFYTPDPDRCPPPRIIIPCPCPPLPCPCEIVTVFGILTGGPFGTGPGLTNNVVTRITPQAINNLMQWR
jgi:glutamyl endopeptidase